MLKIEEIDNYLIFFTHEQIKYKVLALEKTSSVADSRFFFTIGTKK